MVEASQPRESTGTIKKHISSRPTTPVPVPQIDMSRFRWDFHLMVMTVIVHTPNIFDHLDLATSQEGVPRVPLNIIDTRSCTHETAQHVTVYFISLCKRNRLPDHLRTLLNGK